MTPYIGEIRLFPYNFAPLNWLPCDGRLLPIAEYDTLFSLLGTTYGGDGQTTFALPDLRGRVPIHQGQGPGLSPYVVGQMSGSEQVTLLTNQMPAHSHTLTATTAAATALTPNNSVLPGTVSGDTFYVSDIAGTSITQFAPQAVNAGGGSQPHDNLMPTLTVQFCIAYSGIYPQVA